jgi:hypothetical protein
MEPKERSLPNMKSIPLYNAYSLLRECRAVVIDGKCVEPYNISYSEDPENEFLILQWEEELDDEMLSVEVSFREGDNQMVEVDKKVMLLVGQDGETEELILLKEMVLEARDTDEFN